GPPGDPVGYWWQVNIGSSELGSRLRVNCDAPTSSKYYVSPSEMTCTTGAGGGCNGTQIG
ncbi:MAG: hypothetical protein COY57_01930, partial [Flavobacteriales bacterium CG_4_10_14_0_8_um_filter_32_5]